MKKSATPLLLGLFILLVSFVCLVKDVGAGPPLPFAPRTNPIFKPLMRPDLSIVTVTPAPEAIRATQITQSQEDYCARQRLLSPDNLPAYCLPSTYTAYLYEVVAQNNGPDLSAGTFLKIRALNGDGVIDQEVWIELTNPLTSGGQMRFRLGHYSGEVGIGSVRVDAVNSDGSAIAESNRSNNIYTFPRLEDSGVEVQGGE